MPHAFIRCLKFRFGSLAILVSLAVSVNGAAGTVEQWGVFDIPLSGSTNGNPFVDVQFSARFSFSTSTVEVVGFYDGDGIYRVRFMPDKPGHWRYTTHSNRPELDVKTGEFVVTSPTGSNHGPVQVANTYHFAYGDGSPFRPIGTTSYNWAHMADALEEQTLASLAAAPFNKIRMCIFPKHNPESTNELALFPFAGTPPKSWDFSRFDPRFFQHLEKRVGDLCDRGIEAELILFDPYDKGRWGFDRMPVEVDDRYVRYLVSRLAAYRNVWWSLSNEYDFNKQKKESDWDRLFHVLQAADPYGHPRSIHNGFLIYNNTQPWVTHASIQNGSAVEDAGRAELYRDVYRKPVVYDEVKYEGNIWKRWGNLSAEEMVFRFWQGTVAGTYVTHGEVVTNEQHILWTSEGGKLHGQSPPRLAFLRQVLAESPATGIDPIDKWQDSNMGGKLGEYYLLYFGKQTPTSWPFELYKDRIANGMKFTVEVLDTWAMTTMPVEGEFVAKKKDNYHFVDEKGRAVPLPGKPYMAVCIRRVREPVGSSLKGTPPPADVTPE
ncbi:MAG TPA: DUF5060 domain-containing protein [Verrucomicrobiae bacterium]|nr:DUF5060 domain-containing protein [Verrucomicrobiae bacterium]